MRLTVCALSAVLLSGCSWMGMGASGANSHGYNSASGCYGGTAGYSSQYGASQYGYSQAGYGGAGGCGAAGGYAVAGNGYGAGANGYGMGAGANGLGLRGGYGANGAGMYGMGAGSANGMYGAGSANGMYGAGSANGMYGAGGANGMYGAGGANGMYGAGGANGMYGAGGGTVLGGSAPYGSAVGGATQYASSGQYINGQWVAGGGNSVQTIQGAPIYVPQPYPAYYGVGYNAGFAGGLRGSSAMPFGFEAGVGTELGIGGDIVGAKPAGPGSGGGAHPLNVSATPAIGYKDAYKEAVSYDLGATYDIDPSTTLIGRVGYSNAEGERLKVGTIDDGSTTEDLYAQWSDLEQVTLEGGFRKYMGGWNNGVSGMRPYVGAMAGFAHNGAVTLTQDSATLMPTGSNVQQYIDAGWTPTASGVVGAEMQVGPRTAIGVETGIRWRDDLNTISESDSRWSVPVKLRGRVSF